VAQILTENLTYTDKFELVMNKLQKHIRLPTDGSISHTRTKIIAELSVKVYSITEMWCQVHLDIRLERANGSFSPKFILLH